jgi:hypothetical protein
LFSFIGAAWGFMGFSSISMMERGKQGGRFVKRKSRKKREKG